MEVVSDRKHILICIGLMACLFLFSVWFGYALAYLRPEDVRQVVNSSLSKFSFVKNLNLFLIFLFIFLNNAIKGLAAIIFGTIFGIAPIFFIFVNGELLGFVFGIAKFNNAEIMTAIATLPHGILEIPAVILCSGYGLWLGYRFYRFIFHRDPFKIYFLFAMKKYLRLILPILFFAALIETFVTPYVLLLFTRK
jgi:stage II sporulation protein M